MCSKSVCAGGFGRPKTKNGKLQREREDTGTSQRPFGPGFHEVDIQLWSRPPSESRLQLEEGRTEKAHPVRQPTMESARLPAQQRLSQCDRACDVGSGQSSRQYLLPEVTEVRRRFSAATRACKAFGTSFGVRECWLSAQTGGTRVNGEKRCREQAQPAANQLQRTDTSICMWQIDPRPGIHRWRLQTGAILNVYHGITMHESAHPVGDRRPNMAIRSHRHKRKLEDKSTQRRTAG